MARAKLLFTEKRVFEDGTLYEVIIWAVPVPVPPATHGYKYRLFYGRPGQRVISYDNERGKGDHKHIRGTEVPYQFVSISVLLDDFKTDVEEITGKKL
jgi:hypothetical protein